MPEAQWTKAFEFEAQVIFICIKTNLLGGWQIVRGKTIGQLGPKGLFCPKVYRGTASSKLIIYVTASASSSLCNMFLFSSSISYCNMKLCLCLINVSFQCAAQIKKWFSRHLCKKWPHMSAGPVSKMNINSLRLHFYTKESNKSLNPHSQNLYKRVQHILKSVSTKS